MRKILIVFGTRPEVIKMAPVVQAVREQKGLEAITCATAQHRNLLDQPLQFFQIKADYDLNLMKPNQDLTDITVNCLDKLRDLLRQVKPDVVLVQGDTTTTFAAALAAFYAKISVGHVEAGLRTGQKYSPYPEELNRRLVSPLADLHFAPTELSQQNLLKEGIDPKTVHITGNTSIDALLWGRERLAVPPLLATLRQDRKVLLMTAHRRENFGAPLEQIFGAVRAFAEKHPEFVVFYPVHPNPNVQAPAARLLSNLSNVHLISPLSYDELLYLMKESEMILTDSGGIQEEAPTLGKPVLILRQTTERPEGVDAGCAKLVGHDPGLIADNLEALTDRNSKLYQQMSQAKNPYGDGNAAKKIAAILAN